jgi:hypothetical protein
MPPYSNDTMRSVYHVREFEVFKLKQVPLLLLLLRFLLLLLQSAQFDEAAAPI